MFLTSPRQRLVMRCCSSSQRSAACLSTTASSARSRRRTSSPTKSTSCTGRSAPKPSRAFRTGSGWCCRASSPSICPVPAATRRSACSRATDHEMPIGLSKVTVGFPRVGINCAMCHAASFRARPDDVPTIYPAAASHQTGEQEYLRFLIACAVGSALHRRHHPGGDRQEHPAARSMDRLLYRFAIIPGTRRALLRLRDQDSWMHGRPDWGRGRIDPFNPVKFTTLRQPIDDTIGNSDMMPLWNLRRREGTAYHWDGLNTTLARGGAVVGDRRRRHDGLGRSRLRQVEQHRSEDDVEPAARDELHRRPEGAEVSVPGRREPGGGWRGHLQVACAPVVTSPAARAPGRSFRSPRSAPIAIASTCGRRTLRPPTTPTAKDTPGSSRISARRPATPPFRSTASG